MLPYPVRLPLEIARVSKQNAEEMASTKRNVEEMASREIDCRRDNKQNGGWLVILPS